jgi:hypothetical protein
VQFFSQEWKKLGDKQSLVQQIHEATGIPNAALQGAPMVRFSEKERFRGYKAARQRSKKTKRTHYLAFLTLKCRFATKKAMHVHLKDSKKRSAS